MQPKNSHIVPAAFLACLASFNAYALDYAQMSRSAYRIFTLSTDGSVRTGSGVQVAHDRILTNCHVVANAKAVEVEYSPSRQRFSSTGVANDQAHDACVLEVKNAPGKTIPQARFVSSGDVVHVLGYPQSNVLIASRGKVLNPEFKLNDDVAIQTDNYCAPGGSGGPLLNEAGELVGLIFAGNNVTKNCLAIPAYYLQRVQAESIAPFSTGAPNAGKGSVYHKQW